MIFYSKSINNKRKYVLLTQVDSLSDNMTPAEIKAMLIREAVKMYGPRVINKRVKERLSSYRFIKDLVTDINTITRKYSYDSGNYIIYCTCGSIDSVF